MYRVINEKGLFFLTRLIINMSETIGKERMLDVIKNDPQSLIDILSDDHFSESNVESVNFSKKLTTEDLEKLKLTKLQKIILETVLNNKNSVTLNEIELSLKERGIDVNSGSMIGGSLAGITKKCESSKITNIYKAVHGDSTITYSIIPEVKKTLKSFLESH
jgi:hypothetical protein